MKFNPEIFRDYDIRGVYGKDFDADFAFQLGAAFVRYLNRRKFLVANDGRDFSHMLAESLMKGILSAGGDVEYIGLSSLPLFYFALNELGANGGAMVTASHNPPEYGGFKLFRGGYAPIDSESGLSVVEQLLGKGGEISKYGGRIGRNQTAEIKRKYIKYAGGKFDVNLDGIKDLKVKIKGEGTGSEEARTLLDNIGISYDEAQFDIAFSFDGDADRLIVSDGAGEQIRPDFIMGLIVKDKRGLFFKPRAVCALNFSKGVLEKFEEWGVKTYRSKVGRPHIREMMVGHRADFGGELSGHILFKNNHYCELPLGAMLKILKIINKTGKNISQLVGEFKTWFDSGEINIAANNWPPAPGELFGKLKEKYKDGKIDELDGVTVEYPDWWFNLRPSNTEPVLRLVVEAKTKNLLDEKAGEIMKIVKA